VAQLRGLERVVFRCARGCTAWRINAGHVARACASGGAERTCWVSVEELEAMPDPVESEAAAGERHSMGAVCLAAGAWAEAAGPAGDSVVFGRIGRGGNQRKSPAFSAGKTWQPRFIGSRNLLARKFQSRSLRWRMIRCRTISAICGKTSPWRICPCLFKRNPRPSDAL